MCCPEMINAFDYLYFLLFLVLIPERKQLCSSVVFNRCFAEPIGLVRWTPAKEVPSMTS